MAANDHAIVVGIRTYPKLRPLRGPCKDAEAFRDWLLHEDKGAVPKANIRFLTTESFDEPDSTDHPFADDVNTLFQPFVEEGHLASRRGETLGRRLYIFMAGHGFSERGDETRAALLAANAAPSFALNVAATEYVQWFKYNAVFDEIVLLLDCCRTTSAANSITPPPLPLTAGSPRRHQVATFFGYAVTDGQPAREQEVDGLWRGIFTSAVLDALEHALPNRAGRVRGRELADYIHNKLSHVQPPELSVNDRRDVLFARRPQANALSVSFRLDPFAGNETVVITDGSGTEADRFTPASAQFEEPLTAGLYKVSVEGSTRTSLFEVPRDEQVVI